MALLFAIIAPITSMIAPIIAPIMAHGFLLCAIIAPQPICLGCVFGMHGPTCAGCLIVFLLFKRAECQFHI